MRLKVSSQPKGQTVGTRNLEWKSAAACRTVDTSIFFPDNDAAAAPALAVCARCPVREECLDFALQTRQHEGIWGGTTESERRRLRRARTRRQAA